MTFSLLSAANWPIIGQICWLLGKVMNFIYTILDNVLPSDNGLVGLSIIFYTIFVYTLMLPMTVSQQRMQKLSAVTNPEVQAIQKKYKNKKDQASMMKQQEEIQQVYDKYGTSMMGGCLPLLIQMPLLLALYPVIYDMQTYVPAIKDAPASVNQFLTIPDMTVSPITMIKNSGSYGMAPAVIIITAILIPVLSGLTQYLSVKISQAISGTQMDKDNPMAAVSKSMNIYMPIFSVVICITLPAGVGLYWVASSVVRIVMQVGINAYMNKLDMSEIMKKNIEKQNKKREMKGLPPIRDNANINVRKNYNKTLAQIEEETRKKKEPSRPVEKQDNTKYYEEHGMKQGSIASKARMVEEYNKKNQKK